MKGFIEIETCKQKKLLNVRYIEEIRDAGDGECYIYMAFSVPGADEQDFYLVSESYEEIKRKIREAVEEMESDKNV